MRHLGMVLGVFAAAAMAQGAAPPKTFTVATFNINYGNPNLAGVVKILRAADADVVALQETNPQSEKKLRRALAKQYPHMVFKTASAAGGFGFLSKVPLKDVRYSPRSAGWFGCYQATAKLDGRDVRLVSLHLQPTLPKRGESLWRFLARWTQFEAVRVKEVAAILKTLPKDTPAILLGDCNTTPGSDTVKAFTSAGYRDTFRTVRGPLSGETSWKWTYRGMTWRFRLDYIFASPALEATASEIDPRYASDHRLVKTTFRWTPKEAADQGTSVDSETKQTGEKGINGFMGLGDETRAHPDSAYIPLRGVATQVISTEGPQGPSGEISRRG